MQRDMLDTVFSPVKIFCHDRMYAWKHGENIYPITVELGPAGPANCNNQCSFCMHKNYYDAKAMMSFEFYKRTINELKTLGTKGIIFSASGEPLTNPEFRSFISYTHKIGIEQAVITNGSWLHKLHFIPVIVDNCSWIRVSLDAGTAETRKKIHGVNDFDRVLKSLNELATQRKKRNSDISIGAQIVVTDENWWEIPIAIERVHETGIDYFQVKPVVFHPKDNKEQLSSLFWDTVLYCAENAAIDYEDKEYFNVYIKYDQFEAIMKPDHDKSAYDTCRATFFPIIEATGKVYHCSQTRGLSEFELGDLNRQSFKEIWNSERRREIIENIDVSECQCVCRCHYLNRLLKTVALKENKPSFI